MIRFLFEHTQNITSIADTKQSEVRWKIIIKRADTRKLAHSCVCLQSASVYGWWIVVYLHGARWRCMRQWAMERRTEINVVEKIQFSSSGTCKRAIECVFYTLTTFDNETPYAELAWRIQTPCAIRCVHTTLNWTANVCTTEWVNACWQITWMMFSHFTQFNETFHNWNHKYLNRLLSILEFMFVFSVNINEQPSVTRIHSQEFIWKLSLVWWIYEIKIKGFQQVWASERALPKIG